MKPRSTAVLSILLLLLAALVWWFAPPEGTPQVSQAETAEGRGVPGSTGEERPGRTPDGRAETASTRDAATPESAADLVVRNVVVRDVDGRVAWRGDVDLAPALQRISAGVSDPHRNDGGVFGNREGLLPARERGYYREYVVRTPGLSHAGPQRLVVGRGGEVFYTFDHYESFRRVR